MKSLFEKKSIFSWKLTAFADKLVLTVTHFFSLKADIVLNDPPDLAGYYSFPDEVLVVFSVVDVINEI